MSTKSDSSPLKERDNQAYATTIGDNKFKV
jgi:hypothetical protein